MYDLWFLMIGTVAFLGSAGSCAILSARSPTCVIGKRNDTWKKYVENKHWPFKKGCLTRVVYFE